MREVFATLVIKIYCELKIVKTRQKAILQTRIQYKRNRYVLKILG